MVVDGGEGRGREGTMACRLFGSIFILFFLFLFGLFFCYFFGFTFFLYGKVNCLVCVWKRKIFLLLILRSGG